MTYGGESRAVAAGDFASRCGVGGLVAEQVGAGSGEGGAAGKADEVSDRLHDAAVSPVSAGAGAAGIKAAGYRYVAWGTTHSEAGEARGAGDAADAPPAKAKELGQRCRDLGLEPLMMFSGIYPEDPKAWRCSRTASSRPRRPASAGAHVRPH